ncbi:ATP-binding cassette domain-containing protein [Streptomyces roseifaciens]|uniref:ATP-binding cassette domain-containing protein n=1 Tax=Streptomyces roseifaciens TaxID=1488406 RepID=UPI00099FD4EE
MAAGRAVGNAVGNAVELGGLRKAFGGRAVLDGLDLHIPAGRVTALLGPNGAGKTTTVQIITTLLRPDAGRAFVLGTDVVRHPGRVRRLIGLSGQYAAVDDKLTGFENLRLVARLYGMPRTRAAATARELLERFRLHHDADRPAGTWSGGMRRRLDLAGALVAAPPVVVLDEPTTGLDPQSRLDTWDVVRDLVRDGTTVLLTTQYLEEADHLADRIAVLDRGRVVAEGTVDQLKAVTGGERIEVVVADPRDTEGARRILTARGTTCSPADGRAGRLELTVGPGEGQRALAAVAQDLNAAGIRALDLGLRRATLEDVFLTLTGTSPSADHGPDGTPPDPPAHRSRQADAGQAGGRGRDAVRR